MSITEDELVDSYGTGNAKERFDLIYENYSVFPQLVDCFEIGLFNTILNEKEYNRRAKNSADLGVRVLTTPTPAITFNIVLLLISYFLLSFLHCRLKIPIRLG